MAELDKLVKRISEWPSEVIDGLMIDETKKGYMVTYNGSKYYVIGRDLDVVVTIINNVLTREDKRKIRDLKLGRSKEL